MLSAMRDLDVIESELRLIAAVHRTAAGIGAPGVSGRSSCSTNGFARQLLTCRLETDFRATREKRIVHREHPFVAGAWRHVKGHHGLNTVSGVDFDVH